MNQMCLIINSIIHIDGIEDTKHFLFPCPLFDIQRRELLTGDSESLLRPFVPFVQSDSFPNKLDEDLSEAVDTNALEI